jgi:hypothetical protein
MPTVGFGQLGPAIGLAATAMFSALVAGAQDQHTIELVPQIPHSLAATSVSFSADGARVLKTIKLWDAATGALLRPFEGPFRPSQFGCVLAGRSRAAGTPRSECGTQQRGRSLPCSLAATTVSGSL